MRNRHRLTRFTPSNSTVSSTNVDLENGSRCQKVPTGDNVLLCKVLQIKAGGRLGTAEYRLYIEFCVSVGDKVHYRRLKISLRHLANYT